MFWLGNISWCLFGEFAFVELAFSELRNLLFLHYNPSYRSRYSKAGTSFFEYLTFVKAKI